MFFAFSVVFGRLCVTKTTQKVAMTFSSSFAGLTCLTRMSTAILKLYNYQDSTGIYFYFLSFDRAVKFQRYDVKPEKYEWDDEYEAFTAEEREKMMAELSHVIASTNAPSQAKHKYGILSALCILFIY